MALVKIARGTTKQADIFFDGDQGAPDPGTYWGIAGGPQSNNPRGWNVTWEGVITVPPAGSTPNLPAGRREAYFQKPGLNGGNAVIRRFEFDIVDPTGDGNDCSKMATAGVLSNTINNATLTFHMTASVESPTAGVNYNVTVIVDWKDGTSTTYTGVAPSSTNAFLFDATHTYTQAGDYSPTWRAYVGDCGGGAVGGGFPQFVRYQCQSGACVLRVMGAPAVGYMTQQLCEASGCGFPGAGWYCVVSGSVSSPLYIANVQDWIAAGRPTPRYEHKEDTPCYTPEVYWCQNNAVQSGPVAPPGVTVYPSEAACREAGCSGVTPMYKRWRCSSTPGICEEFLTANINEGFQNCAAANCSGPTNPHVYTRYRCNEDGDCEPFSTLDPSAGYEDCTHTPCAPVVDPPDPCGYVSRPIADITPTKNYPSIFKDLTFTLSRVGIEDRTLVVTYAWNGIPRDPLPTQRGEDAWSWVVKNAGPGEYHFIAALYKAGCPTETEEITVTIDDNDPSNDPYWCVNGVCTRSATKPTPTALGPFSGFMECSTACGGGTDPGDPCSDLPEDFDCSPALTMQAPAANALLKNFVLVRVATADPNEELDPCHRNYPRQCNDDPLGPDLKLFVGEYFVDVAWKKTDGTTLNGIWEAWLDTRDYSNGAKNLRVSMRGVGCCRIVGSVAVTFANTLQGNIFYRDTRAQVGEKFVIPDAVIGVETRALEENTSRRYWEQWGVRSGTMLDGAYKHEDWPKHQPVIPALGAMWGAQGLRFERKNYSAHVTFRLPLSRDVRFRRKWTPQFYLSCFDLNCQQVTKIREVSAGIHYIWTQGPPRLWLYDGEKVTMVHDFGDNTNYPTWTPDAVDAAYWDSDDTGRKIIVIAPESEEAPDGEMFAYDLDADEVTLNYSVRRSSLVPRFIEIVKGVPIALYARDTLTHAHDLRFGAPKRVWTLPDRVTFSTVDDDVLLVACDGKLYSSDGVTAPTLVHDFVNNVTAATQTLVGLENGEVWRKDGDDWVLVHTHEEGRVNGVTEWSAGTVGEAQTDEDRGVFGGVGKWLVGERANGTWYDERELRVPLDLVNKSVVRVTALDHFSIEIAADEKSDAPEQLPQKDERLLAGTGDSGLLFVYQRSLLSEKDAAIAVSHDTVPRVFPFPKRVTAATQ